MTKDITAARARAEARFKAPAPPAESEAARAERELRERTEFEICVTRSECNVESSRRQRRCRRRVTCGF